MFHWVSSLDPDCIPSLTFFIALFTVCTAWCQGFGLIRKISCGLSLTDRDDGSSFIRYMKFQRPQNSAVHSSIFSWLSLNCFVEGVGTIILKSKPHSPQRRQQKVLFLEAKTPVPILWASSEAGLGSQVPENSAEEGVVQGRRAQVWGRGSRSWDTSPISLQSTS